MKTELFTLLKRFKIKNLFHVKLFQIHNAMVQMLNYMIIFFSLTLANIDAFE